MDRSARLWIRLRSHATRAISKKLRLPFWPLRVFRMRQTRRNSSREMKKHRRRMFVRLNGIAKRNVSQMLQGIRQRIVRGIPFGPEAVPLRKLLRCKRGQPEQIIGSVLDHVDAQIVSCINAKVRPLRIAKLKPSQLRQPVQGRVFHPLDLRNIDQPPDGLFLKNLSVRRKHFPQLESQQVRITVAGRRINRRLFRRRFAVQPARLEQNRNSAMGHDRIDLLAIERDHLSILALDIRARHERHTGAKRLPRPPQRSEEHTSELQSRLHLVCRLLLEKKKSTTTPNYI